MDALLAVLFWNSLGVFLLDYILGLLYLKIMIVNMFIREKFTPVLDKIIIGKDVTLRY